MKTKVTFTKRNVWVVEVRHKGKEWGPSTPAYLTRDEAGRELRSWRDGTWIGEKPKFRVVLYSAI